METKKKLKLKKEVWIIGVLLIFISLGIYAFINIKKDIAYKKTNEYKLLNVGYTKDEISLLESTLSSDELNTLSASPKNTSLINILNEKYFIKENLNRYLALTEKSPSLSSTKIVSLINTNNDYEYYDHDLDTDTSKDYLLLVNKYYHLNSDYEPADLVSVNNKYFYGTSHKIKSIVYNAFIDMWNEANNEGIYLIINSSYRTYEYQKGVYDDYKNTRGTSYADSIAARPGYSEHQTGLALDIFSKASTTTDNFKGSTAHLWLQNNAHRFGFIERYKEDIEDITGFGAEAWHWRYVGVEAATYIHDNNISFDEYYAYFIENNN